MDDKQLHAEAEENKASSSKSDNNERKAPKKDHPRKNINWRIKANSKKFLKVWLEVSNNSDKDTITISDLWDACEKAGLKLEPNRGVNPYTNEPVAPSTVNKYKKRLISALVNAGEQSGVDKATLDAWEKKMNKYIKDVFEPQKPVKSFVTNDFFKDML